MNFRQIRIFLAKHFLLHQATINSDIKLVELSGVNTPRIGSSTSRWPKRAEKKSDKRHRCVERSKIYRLIKRERDTYDPLYIDNSLSLALQRWSVSAPEWQDSRGRLVVAIETITRRCVRVRERQRKTEPELSEWLSEKRNAADTRGSLFWRAKLIVAALSFRFWS